MEVSIRSQSPIQKPRGAEFNDHHTIPKQLYLNPKSKNHKEIAAFVKGAGWSIQALEETKVSLPTGRKGYVKNDNRSIHRGSHPEYTKKIETELKDLMKDNLEAGYSQEELGTRINNIVIGYESDLKSGDLELNKAKDYRSPAQPIRDTGESSRPRPPTPPPTPPPAPPKPKPKPGLPGGYVADFHRKQEEDLKIYNDLLEKSYGSEKNKKDEVERLIEYFEFESKLKEKESEIERRALEYTKFKIDHFEQIKKEEEQHYLAKSEKPSKKSSKTPIIKEKGVRINKGLLEGLDFFENEGLRVKLPVLTDDYRLLNSSKQIALEMAYAAAFAPNEDIFMSFGNKLLKGKMSNDNLRVGATLPETLKILVESSECLKDTVTLESMIITDYMMKAFVHIDLDDEPGYAALAPYETDMSTWKCPDVNRDTFFEIPKRKRSKYGLPIAKYAQKEYFVLPETSFLRHTLLHPNNTLEKYQEDFKKRFSSKINSFYYSSTVDKVKYHEDKKESYFKKTLEFELNTKATGHDGFYHLSQNEGYSNEIKKSLEHPNSTGAFYTSNVRIANALYTLQKTLVKKGLIALPYKKDSLEYKCPPTIQTPRSVLPLAVVDEKSFNGGLLRYSGGCGIENKSVIIEKDNQDFDFSSGLVREGERVKYLGTYLYIEKITPAILTLIREGTGQNTKTNNGKVKAVYPMEKSDLIKVSDFLDESKRDLWMAKNLKDKFSDINLTPPPAPIVVKKKQKKFMACCSNAQRNEERNELKLKLAQQSELKMKTLITKLKQDEELVRQYDRERQLAKALQKEEEEKRLKESKEARLKKMEMVIIEADKAKARNATDENSELLYNLSEAINFISAKKTLESKITNSQELEAFKKNMNIMKSYLEENLESVRLAS